VLERSFSGDLNSATNTLQSDFKGWKNDADQLVTVCQFLTGDNSNCQLLFDALEPYLLCLYTRTYKPYGMDLKILLFTNAILQGTLECRGRAQYEWVEALRQLTSRALNEIYSFCYLELQSIFNARCPDGIPFEQYQKIVLSVNCLVLSIKFLRTPGVANLVVQIRDDYSRKCCSLLQSVFENKQKLSQSGASTLGNVAVNELLLNIACQLSSNLGVPDDHYGRTADEHLQVLLSLPPDKLTNPSGMFEDRVTLKWQCMHNLVALTRISSAALKVRLMTAALERLQHIEASAFIPVLKIYGSIC